MSTHLHAQIEKLQAENAYLREALAGGVISPPAWGLTAKQAEILAVLYRCRSGWCSRDRIEAGLYGTLNDPRESNVVIVHLSRLRAALRQHLGGEGIHNAYTLGYRLADEARAVLDSLNPKIGRPAA